jgi:methionyl-tRNA synthetase
LFKSIIKDEKLNIICFVLLPDSCWHPFVSGDNGVYLYIFIYSSIYFVDFTEEKVSKYINAELVNTLGNLLSRCSGKKINILQAIPQFSANEFESKADNEDKVMWEKLDTLAGGL